MSKGSNRRPSSVSQAEFDRRWSETFGSVEKYKRDSMMADACVEAIGQIVKRLKRPKGSECQNDKQTSSLPPGDKALDYARMWADDYWRNHVVNASRMNLRGIELQDEKGSECPKAK